MAFCTKCGAQVEENVLLCQACSAAEAAAQNAGPQDTVYAQPQPQQQGYQQPPQQGYYQQPQQGYQQPPQQQIYDAPSGGYAVLGFFFPVVGLILFLVWKGTRPLRAKSAGKGALIAVIVNVAVSIIAVVISLVVYNF